MKIQGRISKCGSFSIVKIPVLCTVFDIANTEKTETVASSWLESIIFAETSLKTKVKVKITKNQLTFSCSQPHALLSTIFARNRRELNMTTRDLAKILGMKSHAAIVRYENGKSEPSLEVIEKIFLALNLNVLVDVN